jgi:GNAT superfamily N-acetyltransferase
MIDFPIMYKKLNKSSGDLCYSIRRARKRDLDKITILNAQLGYPQPKEAVARHFRKISKDHRNHAIYVAVYSGTVVGWIHVYSHNLLTAGPLVEIGGLVVDESMRSRGVGADLLGEAELWAQHKGFTQVMVHTNIIRERAHRFYEKCGYKLLKQSQVYFRDLNQQLSYA